MNKEERAKKTVKMTIEREGVKVNISLDPEIEEKEIIKEITTIKEVEIPVITEKIVEIEVIKEVIKEIKVPTALCAACGNDNITEYKSVERPNWEVSVNGVMQPTEEVQAICANCGLISNIHKSLIKD